MVVTSTWRGCLLLLWVAFTCSLLVHRRNARESTAPSQEPAPWSAPSEGFPQLGKEPAIALWRGGKLEGSFSAKIDEGEGLPKQRSVASLMEELKGERDSADEGNAEVHEIDGDGRGGPEEGMRSQEVDSGEEERTEEEHSKGDEGRADEDASSKTEELFEGHEINHDDTSERDSEPDPTTDNQRNASTCPPIPAGGPPRFYPAPRGLSRARACACTPVAPFILLSMQRSGSGWFETLLNSHPHVRSHGELFSRDTWRGARERARLDDVYNLGRVTEERECLQAVGFKWMLNQGVIDHWEDWLAYVRARGVSVVVLFRRNTLRRMVSLAANGYDKRAKLEDGRQHKSHVHSAEEAEKLAEYKPELDPATLVAKLRAVQATQEAALRMLAGTRHVVLYYEDVMADPSIADRVQDFLGVPPRSLQSKQVPIHTRGLKHHVANWERVAAALAGTPYEGMLYE